MTDRDLWIEIYRNLGHIVKGFTGISVAIAKRYALGAREAETPTGRR
jgi:hypothetical protein